MKYIYDCVVYTDDIVGWEKCRIVDLTTYANGENRATVITKTKAQLFRIIKNVNSQEEVKKDGCIYYIEQ